MTKRKILVVDDNVSLSRLLRQQLEAAGDFLVRVENQAGQALAVMRKFKPDVVVLDVMMPEIDGGYIAAEMKADAALAKTPVIFLTGSVRKEEVKDHHGIIGGMPFLAKPVRMDELLKWIDRLAPARPAGAKRTVA
ncbi:MAG TPA: response regulator [Verrucomicrobiae bacterium]|jgi:CheY-like chemotaxis protein